MDVIQRLEPVVIEIERERECVCVVAHQAILRAIYGYFTKTPLKARSLPAHLGSSLYAMSCCCPLLAHCCAGMPVVELIGCDRHAKCIWAVIVTLT